MKILSIGSFPQERNNTTCHRSDCLREHASYFLELDNTPKMTFWWKIIYHLGYYGLRFNVPDTQDVNKRIVEEIRKHQYDIIWIDKGFNILPKTLTLIKKVQPHCTLVHYMIDDFMNPYHKTKQILDTIPLYDYYIVNRKANVEELKAYGCKNPICTFMSYEPKFHHPYPLEEEDKVRLGGDVGFIGTYEKDRAESIKFLADNEIPVRVWGGGWEQLKDYSPNLRIEGKGLYTVDFCKAIQCFKINLGFLRKKSRDYHTTRTFEIPGCGGFLLAERTDEHLSLFEEDKEAAFFSSNEELLEKCRYYLSHEDERKAIAHAGHKRCESSGYSNEEVIKKMLDIVMPVNK